VPLSKIKLLAPNHVEYKKDKPKILDRLAATFGGEWGN